MNTDCRLFEDKDHMLMVVNEMAGEYGSPDDDRHFDFIARRTIDHLAYLELLLSNAEWNTSLSFVPSCQIVIKHLRSLIDEDHD